MATKKKSTPPKMTAEVRAKLAAKAKGRTHAPEVRERLRQLAKQRWANPNDKLRQSHHDKRKDPPKNAAKLIREAIAEFGANVTAICEMLGCSNKLFYAWLKRFPDLKEAFDEGRSVMEDKLVSVLFQQAMKGVYPAAMFLLKTKCGYRDSGPVVNSDGTAEDKAEKIRRLLQEMEAADGRPPKEPVQ